MFDYRESKQPHFDIACVSFVKKHNVTDLANKMGVSAQVLRNKLNPDQAHNLSCQELLTLTDLTEDPTLIDGLLAQLQCMPAVPVNELSDGNIANYTLHAAAAVGAVANSAVSPERQSRQTKNAIIESVNAGIRHLSLIGLAIQGRVEANPALASAVGVVTSVATNGML